MNAAPTAPHPSEPARPLLLLVDDQPANLHVLAAALRDDYRLRTATGGGDALALLERAELPELILLDVMMPGMSGLEVMRHLRAQARTREIPVIFVSADNSEQSQLNGLDLGADDYLTKPVVAAVLRARVRNLLARKRTERQLRLAAHVFEHSGEAIMITDQNNDIVDVNPAFTRLTGYSQVEVRGRNPRLLSSGRAKREEFEAMWRDIREKGFWQGEMWDRDKDGGIYPKLLTISVVRNAEGRIDYHIASFADISAQKAAEERIRHIAHHDALTGLPNRLHLHVALEQAIAAARREGGELAMLFIDLDRFKVINDTLGHNVGDSLLVEVARRLRASLRDSDLVARLGGDEFVVVLDGAGAINHAAHAAEKILASLSRPCQIEDIVLHTTPSIGISLYPQDGEDIEVLMKRADTAMYHAKEAGRSQFHFYTESMNRRTREHLALENSLHLALEQGEFVVHYQPQADVVSGRPVCAEALIRWRHPQRGLLGPDEFIPLAEENGMILQIGEWVLREVCRQLVRWRERGLPMLPVAVNLSARQFRQDELAGYIRDVLREAGLPARAIELEITESTAMARADASGDALRALHDAGLSIAIDDFGTGYSSLGYLKRFPVDKLKIDRSFVMDIPHDANDTAIAVAIIQMARALGIQVVAEGVETEAQRDFLRDQGCPFLQGYWYSRPLDADAYEAFVRVAMAGD